GIERWAGAGQGRFALTERIGTPLVLALTGAGLTAGGAQAAGSATGSASAAPASGSIVRAAGSSASAARPDRAELRERLLQAYRGTLASNQRKRPSPMIIGGKPADISSAPWTAQLLWVDPADPENGFFCGGSVVSPTKIVTAAHCVEGVNWAAGGYVVIGATQLLTRYEDGTIDTHGGTLHKVSRQWMHPSYDTDMIDNDVAVLTLATKTSATNLPLARAGDTAEYTAGNVATVHGWGRYSSGHNDLSPSLKKADLPFVSDATCEGFWGDFLVRGHMVCAGKPASGSDSGTNTACNGDSGGPLVRNGRLVGVVSWGVTDCVEEGAYGVYAKATTFAGPLRAEIYDANWNRDAAADVIARNSGDKDLYPFTSKLTWLSKGASAGDATSANLIRQSDVNRDGVIELISRRSNGDLLRGTTKLFSGWQTRRQIVVPGDVTGDDKPDLVSVTSGGDLQIHAGDGAGGFGAAVKAGFGWQIYNAVRGYGDLTGDGRADLVARDSAGGLYLYAGTGKTGAQAFAARVKVGGGWQIYNELVMTGDINNDGRADLLARDAAGTMWLYKGTGKSSAIFATRVNFGGGWKPYDLIG
ncbi:trypsin-like serine protease, partial [Streptomyces sp. NPDC097619]|uniref:trypsin-like serine protease n=1 Tax=Streptomyces sp. NPDC097619 TaxID=3157228 RepID=UPI0033262934